MTVLSQNQRLIQIDTPVGKDALIVSELTGEERMSDLFRYTVDLLSDNQSIAQKDLLGKSVTLSIHTAKSTDIRYIHGYVNHLAMLDVNDEGLRRYRIEVVPGLWFTTLGSQNRIFENKSSKDIINEVLGEYGAAIKSDFKASGPFVRREYCVQYEENDFTFISRLLAEEGVAYYFTHEKDKHTLVFAGEASDYFDAEKSKIEYDGGGAQPLGFSLHSWQRTYNFHTTSVDIRDYSEFTTTKDNKQVIKTKSSLNSISGTSIEAYGLYHFEADGNSQHRLTDKTNKDIASRAMESIEGTHDIGQGTGNAITLTAGGRFDLEHQIKTESGKYVVTQLNIVARDGNSENSHFSNRFSAAPADKLIRPAFNEQRRLITTPQVATVVEVKATASDSSDDKLTQVKVAFPWGSDQCSCWIRVAQQFAGKGWGANFVPREGQEVIISYINGNPDRPIVTGSLYNGTNDGPNFTSTQSGWKTMVKDSEFNELRFDDKKGNEEIYMEAGKDHNWIVHNDQTGTVENNQTLTVEQNRTATINKGNDALTVSKGNQSTKVDSGNHSLKIAKGTSTIDAMGAIKITSKTSIELKVGANSIKIDQSGVQIKGTMVKAKASAMGEVSAGGILTVKGALTKIN